MPNPTERLTVVAATDAGFAFPTATMAASLVRSAAPGRALSLYVLAGTMPPPVSAHLHRSLGRAEARAARRGVDLQTHVLTPRLDAVQDLRVRVRFSAATYLRLLIPDLLPPDVHRALYLDGDVLVLDDLGPLFDLPLDGALAAAVPNIGAPTIRAGMPRHAERGLDPDGPYMNSGVLLMDLDRWRVERIGAAVLSDLRAHQHLYGWMDQCGLNAVLAGRWADLPPAWNVQAGSGITRAAPPPLSAVSALHFTGNRKPWAAGYAHLPDHGPEFAAYQRAWLGAACRSGWYNRAEWMRYRGAHVLSETKTHLQTARYRLGTLRRRLSGAP